MRVRRSTRGSKRNCPCFSASARRWRSEVCFAAPARGCGGPAARPRWPEIDSKQLIDNHYYSIASKATILDPRELNVPADKFEAKFGARAGRRHWGSGVQRAAWWPEPRATRRLSS
eukprot:COSAG06_NODE_312_length_17767_cov_17.644895_4_plen_116_part_00